MPIYMNAFLLPTSPSLPFLLEDVYVKGGFRTVATDADLEKVHGFARKEGMMVYSIESKITYQLGADKKTWTPFKPGGEEVEFNILDHVDTENPLMMTPVGKKQVISLMNSQKIPPAPGAGYTLVSDATGGLMWVDLSGAQNRGQRGAFEFEAPDYIQPGQQYDFSFTASATMLLIDVILSAAEIDLKIFSSSTRDDLNPYHFISSADMKQDVGIRYENGKAVKLRRYSFLAANGNSKTLFCRFLNIGSAQAKPTLKINYLTLE